MNDRTAAPTASTRSEREDAIPAEQLYRISRSADGTVRVVHQFDDDAAYAILSDEEASTQRRLDDARALDIDSAGNIVGVEFLRVSGGVSLEGVPRSEQIRQELRRLGIAVH